MCKLFATKYWLGEHGCWVTGGFCCRPILPSEKKRQKVLTRPPIEAGAQSRDTVAHWTDFWNAYSKTVANLRLSLNVLKFYLVFPTRNIFVSIIRQFFCFKGAQAWEFRLRVVTPLKPACMVGGLRNWKKNVYFNFWRSVLMYFGRKSFWALAELALNVSSACSSCA
jgi:hypothetical protein